MKFSLLCLVFLPVADAFTTTTISHSKLSAGAERIEFGSRVFATIPDQDQEGKQIVEEPLKDPKIANSISALSATLCLLSSDVANAAGPDWGLFEGKTGSLLHPVMMFGMLTLSASTALLGFEWRRQRTLGGEISDLKKTLPNLNGASSVEEALKALQSAEEIDSSQLAQLKSALPIDAQVKELQNERKALAEKGPKDQHYGQGAMLAFLGTVFAIEGPLNTYARAGKLFPGPHLYAGAGLVCLWALAVACVPQMQKGNETARTVHIGANFGGIGLFLWQLQSGIPILLKVWEKTSWP